MAIINEQFIQVKTKANFEKRLAAGDIKNTSIAFIEDTDQIWVQGKYYSAIPKGGKNNQILSWKEAGTAQWQYLSSIIPNIEEILAYGVQWTKGQSDPHLIRIGNMAFHKTLPIQSQLKGCIAQAGRIMYWLNESDWRFKKEPDIKTITVTANKIVNPIFTTLQYEGVYLKIDSQILKIVSIDAATTTATLEGTVTDGEKQAEFGAVLNGYDGTVRVYCPEFYIKSYTKGDIYQVWISQTKIDETWTKQESLLIDAYRCTVLNTVPANMGYLSTLPVNSTISVVNEHDYCRGGNNDKSWDKYLPEDPCRTQLNKPRTYISRSTMRTYARNSNSELLSYLQYKNIFYWLWVIEYANFNSQERYNGDLTVEGYRQGGMGDGVTIIWSWPQYNGYYPITYNGYGNELGNGTGLIDMPSKSFIYSVSNTKDINQYTKDGAVATITGTTNSVNITNVLKANTRYLYRTWDSQTGEVTYNITGLQEGQTIEFVTNNQIVTTASSDGDITVNWSKDVKADRQLRSQFTGTCNITISIKSVEENVQMNLTREAAKVPRWRGFDNIFGDIWTNLDGIILKRDSANSPSNVYVTDNPENYEDDDTAIQKMEIAGIEIAQDGYTKEFDLGSSAQIIPNLIGASPTTGKNDYHWCNVTYTGLRALLVGASAANGAAAGLSAFYSGASVGHSWANGGFRAVSSFVVFRDI